MQLKLNLTFNKKGTAEFTVDEVLSSGKTDSALHTEEISAQNLTHTCIMKEEAEIARKNTPTAAIESKR